MSWLWVLLACNPQSEDTAGRDFDVDFAWGAATAGFQVDMGCPTWSDDVCLDTASDWYQWVTDPTITEDSSLFVTGEDVRVGPGMWELYEEDIARMQADGLTVYRMSLEWSRLFPDGAAEDAVSVADLDALVEPAALERYHQIFAALDEAGIAPLVTVNHYTLPLWVHDGVACHEDPTGCEASGWREDRIVPLIGRFAGWAGAEFGGEVDRWATLNEPFATTLSGYVLPGEDRSGPPGRFLDGEGAVASMVHQIEGHAAMYDALHAHDTVDADGDGASLEVGLVLNMVAIAPLDADDPGDAEAVEHLDQLYHGLFLDAVVHGDWDDDLDGTVDRTRDDLGGRLDWLGINYYNQVIVGDLDQPLISDIPISDVFPQFSWDPYPDGIAEVVARASEYQVPLIITENGTPYVEDRGSDVLEGHLSALAGAMADGADVRGYLYWSYVDNYEWNHGFDLRFGLYALDSDSKERTEREVLATYRDIISTGVVGR